MPKKPKDFKWLIDVGEAAWEYFTRERQTPTPPPQRTPPPQTTLPKTSPPTPPIRLFDGTGKERLKIPPHFPSTWEMMRDGYVFFLFLHLCDESLLIVYISVNQKVHTIG